MRRSSRTICWTTGMSTMSPGPFTDQKRPSWNTTPRSYSRRILIERNTNTATPAAAPTTKYGMSASLLFHVQHQSVDRRHAHLLAGLERRPALHAPRLALHARPAFALEILQHLAGRADQRLAPAHHRPPPPAQREGAQADDDGGAPHREGGDAGARDAGY